MTYQADVENRVEAPGFLLSMLLRDIAVVLVAGALCLFLLSNLTDLSRGHTELKQLDTRQEATLKTTGKAEAQLDSLARGVQQLASSGNPNAQKIVSVLQSNGVNIKP